MYHNGFVIKINIHVSEVHYQVDKKKIIYFFIGTSSVLTQRNSQLKNSTSYRDSKLKRFTPFFAIRKYSGGTPRTFFFKVITRGTFMSFAMQNPSRLFGGILKPESVVGAYQNTIIQIFLHSSEWVQFGRKDVYDHQDIKQQMVETKTQDRADAFLFTQSFKSLWLNSKH